MHVGIKTSIVLLLVLSGLLILIQLFMSALNTESLKQSPFVSTVQTQSEVSNVRIPPTPIATASDTVAYEDQHPFSALVAYFDTGFEPTVTRIHAGDTVRFINNSTTTSLWIAASGTALYPHEQNDCGSSALDTCRALKPGESWQFTFAKKGSWQFVNNFDKTRVGTIIVQ